MNLHPRRYGRPLHRVLVLVVLVALTLSACLVVQPPAPSVSAPVRLREPSAETADNVAWAIELSAEQAKATSAIKPSAAIAALYNMARGRPPATVSDLAERRRSLFYQQRLYPLDELLVPDANLRAIAFAEEQAQRRGPLAADQTWQSVGPAPVVQGSLGIFCENGNDCDLRRANVSGRTKAIVFDPQNPSILYVSTATGGIWKSTNGGSSFTPVSDHLASLAFHSLAIDPQNPNTLYAGSGEIAGYHGVGLYKTTNGGTDWTLLGANEFRSMAISAILINPSNTNTVYVSTAATVRPKGPDSPARGVFRSTNGGQSWEALLTCQTCDGISDMVMDPTNPNVIYAGVYAEGVYKTTNGGTDWTLMNNGFPGRGFNRVELAIGSGAGANTLYAGLDAAVQVNGQLQAWGLVYKTTNGGQSWVAVENAPNYCSSQCWYDNVVAVSPADANKVFLGGNAFNHSDESRYRSQGQVFMSPDGGASWLDMTPNDSVETATHADMHAIVFHPNNPSEIWIGNDGGLFRSTNGGQTWENRNANLATLQFQNIGIHPTDPNIAFGGFQDNGKARFDGNQWTGMDTGDGGFSEIDPFNPNYWYSTRYSQQGSFVQFQRNDTGGGATMDDWPQKSDGIDVNDRVNFYVPFTLDPSTPGVIYLGTHRVYKTTNRGDSWQVFSPDVTFGGGEVNTLAVAQNNPNYVYTGSSDGRIAVTRNGGANWFGTAYGQAPLPNREVMDIAVHPANPDVIYAAFNGYDAHTPGRPGHVFRSADSGVTWQNASNGLPDIPALTLVIDPANANTLYVGTDIGVFRSTDEGGNWVTYSEGLPKVPVFDLELNHTTRQLWAGTHGRGAFRLNLGGQQQPTPTPIPTIPPQDLRPSWLPVLLKGEKLPRPIPPTNTPPSAGPAAGEWQGDSAAFSVTSNQQSVWNISIQLPAPGCATWVLVPELKPIQNNRFSFDVDLRQNGFYHVAGQFTSSTHATGTANFDNMWLGTSCGNWSGDMQWAADWTGGGSPNPTVTPTATQAPPTPTPPSAQGIRGQARYQGKGIGGLTILLRRCPNQGQCDFAASIVQTTQTDANGYYAFTNAPTLPAGNTYFVMFFNHNQGQNAPDDRFLWRWFGLDITAYTSGQTVAGGSFDLDDIYLTGPATDTTTLPVQFTWTKRNLPGETYAWELFDTQTGQTLCTSDAAAEATVTLTAGDFTGVCGGQYDKEYGWYAWAVQGPAWESNTGFGDSYYFAPITFTEGQVPPTATPTARPPTPTPTQPAGEPGIFGRVTAGGALTDLGGGDVGGINLLLLRCGGTGFNCQLVQQTTSLSSGNYRFANVPALPGGQSYRVAYQNGDDGGNPDNPNYLWYWYSFAITSYSSGQEVFGGNFDIKNVALVQPEEFDLITLPYNFQWAGRGIAGDQFIWGAADDSSELCTSNPTAGTSFTLDANGFDACGFEDATFYYWYVYVIKGADNSQGIGMSYEARSFLVSLVRGSGMPRLLNVPAPVLPHQPDSAPGRSPARAQ